MFTNRSVLLFIGAGILLLGAAFTIFNQGSSPGPAAVLPTPTPVTQASVLVARADIAAGSAVTTTQVLTIAYPSALVPTGAITKFADIGGHITAAPVFSG